MNHHVRHLYILLPSKVRSLLSSLSAHLRTIGVPIFEDFLGVIDAKHLPQTALPTGSSSSRSGRPDPRAHARTPSANNNSAPGPVSVVINTVAAAHPGCYFPPDLPLMRKWEFRGATGARKPRDVINPGARPVPGCARPLFTAAAAELNVT